MTPVVFEILEIVINDPDLEGRTFLYSICRSGTNLLLRTGSFHGLNTQLRLKHLTFGKYDITIKLQDAGEVVCSFEIKPGDDQSEGLRITVYPV